MNYLYLPEAAVECSPASCSDGEPSATSNTTATAATDSSIGCGKGTYIPLPSGAETSESSSPADARQSIADWLTSLAPVSHASHLAAQASGEARPTVAICGPRPAECLTWYDRSGRCWRTSQRSLLADTLEPFSGIWPKSGSMRNGACSARPEAEPPISAKDSGLLPTPTTGAGGGSSRSGNRKNETPTLQGMARKGMLASIPTPTVGDSRNSRNATASRKPGSKHNSGTTLSDFVTMCPTPTARNYRSGKGQTQAERGRKNGPSLAETAGGLLNPTWVEWLMGWPLGWTACEPLETDKFQAWLSAHGVNFRNDLEPKT